MSSRYGRAKFGPRRRTDQVIIIINKSHLTEELGDLLQTSLGISTKF